MDNSAETVLSLGQMFSSIDPDVIALILESNSGNIDAAVNALLEISESDRKASTEEKAPQKKENSGRETKYFPLLSDDFLRPPSHFDSAKSVC